LIPRLFIHQVAVLTVEELRDILRRRRAVITLFLYGGCAVLVARWLAWFQERLRVLQGSVSMLTQHRAEIEERLSEYELQQFLPVFDLLESVPASVWIFQLFALMMLPTLSSWLSSDMVTVDVYRRTLRFVLLRSGRAAYLLSKFVAHSLLLIGVHAVVVGLAVGWGATILEAGSLPQFIRALLWYLIAIVPFSLMTVAGTVLVSAWCSRPITALLMTNALWFLAVLTMFLAPLASPYNGRILTGILVPYGDYLFAGILGPLLWTGVFLGVSLFSFLRREF
jgi:ABC-type transport system involved in multi-copper enzyme maturation permease subunit